MIVLVKYVCTCVVCVCSLLFKSMAELNWSLFCVVKNNVFLCGLVLGGGEGSCIRMSYGLEVIVFYG